MIAALGLVVDGELVSGNPGLAEPDVLFMLPEDGAAKRVGVEVRNVDDQDRSQSWRGTLPRFQDRVRELLTRDAINVQVSGYLRIENVPAVRSRLAATATADTVVTLAREWVAAPTDQPVHKAVLQRRGLEMFRHISFKNSPSADVSFATSGLPLVGDTVQDAIDAKADKLRDRYQYAGVDEVWLLLVARDPISGYVDSGDNVYVSPFVRTVFLDARHQDCVVLETTTE